MEKKDKKVIDNVLYAIPNLIDIYDEDEVSSAPNNATYIIFHLLELLDTFIDQTEVRETIDLLKEAIDIAEDEAEIPQTTEEEEKIVERYNELFKRIDVLKEKLNL